ncbi:NAD(P)-dependent oxidoreductase [Mycobacterium paraseoulense]|uniref:6-phosphogluconate dehydrogenase n=1 Tax=Mycobacterium paraseoulense TaxID=590652 RepID=A0A1X0IBG5_9MYCO|nr:NAD(P)-dependent oxidoreductase [Mycobacterium paraseoulense]MCV7397934.1 NAD(P)-dependent oxidoreductase [Mycobacterium paraseoulense]ORB41014.1 6-phosphogluconate dehydrogenase [Mycobacterium paraseoulense]
MTNAVGFIGVGRLGEPMVLRLLDVGVRVAVYVRRSEVRDRLASRGARIAASVAELATRSDILISCLFSDAQLIEVGLGPDGFVANAKPGSIVVSHTTGTLTTLESLRDDPSAPTILDAPVSGTADDIAAGTLTVLIGGPAEAVQLVTPTLAAYANTIVPTGELGSALALKLINNVLFAANAQLVAAATELGASIGVNPDALLAALQVCSAGSRAATHMQQVGGTDSFAEIAGPFLRKDVAACLAAAAQAGADLGLLGDVVADGPLPLNPVGTK